jgi:hypothetical protein
MLFCQELSLYVTVESLRGGPYFRMETIGSRRLLPNYGEYSLHYKRIQNLSWPLCSDSTETKDILTLFIPYYLSHGHLAFSHKNGMFVQGMPYFDYIIDVSNAFIEFFNAHAKDFRDRLKKKLFEWNFLNEALIADNRFYKVEERVESTDCSLFEGRSMFRFKGEIKHLHIIREENHTELEKTIVINHSVAMYILQNILKVINYRYKNEYNRKQSSGEAASSTYQTVCYI